MSGRARQFWERVTEGIELQQLWRQFMAEARESYSFYSRDVDWNAIGEQKSGKRPAAHRVGHFHGHADEADIPRDG